MTATGRSDSLRVVVLGYIVRGPLGGLSWHHLQYVLGLARLGHEVVFLEDSGDSPWCCYDPSRHVTDADPTFGLRYAERVFDRVGLGDRWAYFDAHTDTWHGPVSRDDGAVADADLVFNVSGVNPLRPWLERVPVRVLVDTDPVFTQVRHLTDPDARRAAAEHTDFLTFAENVGLPECGVPDDGLGWRPTRQPVVLSEWPSTPGPAEGSFTTVMQWESYEAQVHDGVRYGLKADSFRPYLDLPTRMDATFELAMGGVTAPVELLATNGWVISDPLEVAPDPWAYQAYIRRSKAEFSIAKHGYVMTSSGWFSERTAGYLASGRPAVVQDTGFSRWMEAREGVVPFESPDGARLGVEDVQARYGLHCSAARDIATEYFAAEKVLSSVIEDLGISS